MSGSYVKQIQTPANTQQASAIDTSIMVSSGLLTEIKIAFPPGCASLLRVQIKHYEQVIIPLEPDESIGWDNFVWVIPYQLEFKKDTQHLSILTWNLDKVNPHTITIALEILPQGRSILGRLSDIEHVLFGNPF